MRDFIRFLIEVLRPYGKTIFWCSLLAITAAGAAMLGPIALGRAVDVARDGGTVAVAIAGIAGWLAIEYVGEYIRNYLGRRGSMIAYETVSHHKLGAVDAILRKPLSFHYARKSGDVTEKLASFENETENVIADVVFDLAPALLAMAAMLGYLAWLDWRVAALLAATVFAAVWYKYRLLPKALESQMVWRAAAREVNSTAWDAIKNVLIVKSNAAERSIAARLADRRVTMLEKIDSDVRFDERMFTRQSLIIRGGSALTLLVALLNVRTGAFSFGDFTAVSAYTFGIFGYVRYIQWQMRTLTRASATYLDMREMLDTPAEDYVSGMPIDLKGGIELKNVRYRYREDVPVLEDVTFKVMPGERVAIVGESGEGKTTLIDLIGRYHLPQEGVLLYDGKDGKDVNLASLREQIGLVPQDLPLLHDSLGENIRFGKLGATDEEMRTAAKLASLGAFIDSLPDGYATVVGERGLKLSGGQRQRIALARAFIRDPKILILDEPTSNLDSKTEEEIQRSLETLMKGRTTFIIAHRLRTVRDADRILVLKGGRIVEQGRHDELVAKNGAYAALLRTQTGLVAADEVKEENGKREDEETAA